MNDLPLFGLARNNAAVQALLGTDPMRLYSFGQAPQDVQPPYAVWQVVGGAPHNLLSGAPDMDTVSVQVDVYAINGSEARNITHALRDVFQTAATIVAWRGQNRVDGLYREGFDMDWQITR